MLDQVQGNQYTRMTTLATFFLAFLITTNKYDPFAAEYLRFLDNKAELDLLVPDKNVNTSGATEDKNTYKTNIATNLSLTCGYTKAYAMVIKDTVLESKMLVSKSDILKMKDSDILGYVTNIINIINPLLNITLYKTYGVTAASLALINTDATSFNGMIGQTTVTVSGGTVANDNINNVIKALQSNIEVFNLLIGWYSTDYPDYVTGYKKNSKDVILGRAAWRCER